MKIDIDALAQEIRRIDGWHDLGAGALAEALAPYLEALAQPAAAIAPKAPSYGALEIIYYSVCGALQRAGVTDCDDPGEAIDVIREGYEERIAALSQPGAGTITGWRLVDGVRVFTATAGELAGPQEFVRRDEAIPRLPNCGMYHATDNAGHHHYLNHANTWQAFQGTQPAAAVAWMVTANEHWPVCVTGAKEGTDRVLSGRTLREGCKVLPLYTHPAPQESDAPSLRELRERKQAMHSGGWEEWRDYRNACIDFAEAAIAQQPKGAL